VTDAKQFMEEIACPSCARTGHATWDGEAGTRRTLVDIGDGFDQREDSANPGFQMIACTHCGTTQPLQASPVQMR
jgi:Fe-S-cluster-containing dehydrogenase component